MVWGCKGRKLGEEETSLSSSKLLEAKEKLNVIPLNPQEEVTGKVTAKESLCRSLVNLTVLPHFYGVMAPAEFIQIKTTVEEMKWEGCEAKTWFSSGTEKSAEVDLEV